MKEIVVSTGTSATRQEPIKRKPLKTPLIKKVLDIIADDLHAFISRRKLVIEQEPDGWEDYKRFCELARKK